MPVLAVDLAAVLSWTLSALVVAAVLGVVFALATDDREPSIVLAWLLVILMIPVGGIVAYYFIGRNHRRETRRRAELRDKAREDASRALTPVVRADSDFSDAVEKKLLGTPGQRVEATGRREGGMVPLPADSIRVYVAGADKFGDLLEDLGTAKHFIHLMYLIWEQDALTAQVTRVLQERVAAGVEVRILYDWVSCLPYKKAELKQLAAAGAVVVPCYRRPSQLNYRNHMKMAIVDGAMVYSGGMNMGQEYIDGGERFETWRDTSFRLTGPVVAPYQWLFASTWSANGRSEDLYTDYVRAPTVRRPGDGVPVQVLHSSVSTDFPAIRDVFVTALLNARRSVWVQSPYFVPDEPLITAMCVAATSGVDVRLMMTGVPDKKVPFYAAHAYYRQLLDAGVTVYQYRAGFLHAKTVTVDDDLVIMGTCNWDIRSIILHDEVVSVFYDEQVASAYARQYERDVAGCHEVTRADLAALSGPQRLRNSTYRLFSRLL
ncbi:cardiolipin synthase [Nocardioides mesophilus]|uniref:Cardiolipin synthase n=1 Tax=Nocardioides mesophilus TaxID=433659 RepID=A0A7G9R8D2_9ACTN|nr:cardiolipin synthase [Nocardioides mesophilus]QNN51857.1 cardiolipin synthase [Nocardioides mesophilus]